MQVTIIVPDQAVTIDGVGYAGLDLTGLPENVRALQWDGVRGEVEFEPQRANGQLTVPPNQWVDSLDPFQAAIDAWNAAHAAASLPPPPPTPEQVQARFVAGIQARLDNFARTRNYDGILSACTYATSTVPKFAAEGQYCVQLRDATWASAYQILAEVQAGTRAMPTSIADIEADLPVLAWPVGV